MSQADTIYSSLMSKGVEPSVANEFLKGFSGAQAYRDKYAQEYNQTKKGTPTTSIFTPEVVNQVIKDQQQLQSGGLKNPNASYQIPSNPPPVAQPPPGPPPAPLPSGSIACNRVTNSEWFCDFKFPSAQKIDTDTTETSLQACQKRCFEKNENCGGWSIRQKDGVCRLYTATGTWPYKDQMASAAGWVAGPRWNTRQGIPAESTTTTTSNDDDTTTTAAPVTTPPPTGLQKLWRDNKPIIIIGIVFLIFMILGSSFSAILLVMS